MKIKGGKAVNLPDPMPGFTEYLRQYKVIFRLLLLFVFILAGVFYIYRLPVEAVLYGGALCLCGAAPLLWRHYRACRARIHILINMERTFRQDPDRYFLEDFPPAETALEAVYQNFVKLAAQDRERVRSRVQEERAEMRDYYTLWVHQIKTPIAAMDLLLQNQEWEERALRQQLFKIEEYVNMALQYLRLDGEGDLVIGWYDLDALIRQAVRKYAGVFIGKKLSLTYEPLNCRVLTDEKWMVFMVEQLLSNAVKYTEKGGVTISLEQGEKGTLVIRDTGIGIAWEDQPRIFEKGFTGLNGRSHKSSTGIGLYLCSRIARRLSHQLTVESEPGKGTAIRLTLETEPLAVE